MGKTPAPRKRRLKGCLSATQDRNARKRASVKKTKNGKDGKVIVHTKPDPSLQYIADPRNAPTVVAFRKFFKDCGVEGQPVVNLGQLKGWRTEAKLAVRSSALGIQIGLFSPGSHDICRVDGCPAHHDAINKALQLVEAACRHVGVNGYNEQRGDGDLRYVKLEVQRATGMVQLTLVWHAASELAAGPKLRKLVEKLEESDIWYNIWVNFHPASKHVSRILAFEREAWHQLTGRHKVLRERLTTVPCPFESPPLCFPPFVFRQANLCAFEGIVTAIRSFVPEKSRVVELYGGVGTIGLHLADLVVSLACSDENPHNHVCFERSARTLPEEFQARLSYHTGDAGSQVESLKRATLIIVDPPRKGLDELVVSSLETPPACLRRLIYVSCGFPALQRDVTRLLGAGWTIMHVEGFILFPGADHLETLCILNAPPVVKETRREKRGRKREAAEAAAPRDANGVL